VIVGITGGEIGGKWGGMFHQWRCRKGTGDGPKEEKRKEEGGMVEEECIGIEWNAPGQMASLECEGNPKTKSQKIPLEVGSGIMKHVIQNGISMHVFKMAIKPFNCVQNGITKHVIQNGISRHVLQNSN
jgi:hypothetical protein